ncbi:IS256 family transposase, variant Zn-binding type [Otariodibacter oris]|uniref:IS256 family transposase, variant Zn-binding type n=1 Tax=Otariodibacter oris TaxID=1032623 RepID=UPI003AB73AED
MKKNGYKSGKQQYKCLTCNRQFLGGKRLNNQILWQEYTQGKQTYKQLADKYGCSQKTIQRRLDTIDIKSRNRLTTRANIVMDTTYFGRSFGLMVFIDASRKVVLHHCIIDYETNALYQQGIEYIKSQGVDIKSITCDGRRGLNVLFKDIPMQMCQFHQLQIITRYLTRRPQNIASIALRHLVLNIKSYDKTAFIQNLESWYLAYKDYLNERSINAETGKTWYTHKRLRSAYRNLRTNSNWLFTYRELGNLNIPNTTNSLEGLFSELKRQLSSHNGLSKQRKIKFIKHFLLTYSAT